MDAMEENGRFERGIVHFNAREFFAAHEAWEELWLRVPEPEKTFLQGIIQIAAGFHHYMRRNSRGARSLFAAGLAKLNRCPTAYRGVDMARLRNDARKWSARLTKPIENVRSDLPKIRLVRRPRKKPAKKKKRRMR